MAVGLLALNGNAVLRLLNDILCHYFLFVIRCHSASFGKRLSFFAILKIGNSESASSTQKELHYPTFFSIFVVEYSGQGEIPYRR